MTTVPFSTRQTFQKLLAKTLAKIHRGIIQHLNSCSPSFNLNVDLLFFCFLIVQPSCWSIFCIFRNLKKFFKVTRNNVGKMQHNWTAFGCSWHMDGMRALWSFPKWSDDKVRYVTKLRSYSYVWLDRSRAAKTHTANMVSWNEKTSLCSK